MEPGKSDDEKWKVCQSPGHTLYYVPICDESIKPRIGQEFGSKQEAEILYSVYAEECGFIPRSATETKSKDGSTVWKYFLCAREGFATTREYNTDTTFKRRRIYDRCGCKARIKIRMDGPGKFILREFEERHTHPLVPSSQKYLMRSKRKLSSHHQDFIINCLKTNIGASKAFKLYKNSVGSYSAVGATLVDFKNLTRDLNFYMRGCDGQMVIDSLFQKKIRSGAFYFAFDLNERHEISRLFWSDGICRRSYKTFGDVVSADATYKSNRYDMVFVPFTGVDNHYSSVTFGFGLLLNEDEASYIWLFEQFKLAMGDEPNILLTDQDHAVKAAVEKVFTKATHRFCMWHIMFKVSSKVKLESTQVEDFRKRFNSIVWSNDITEAEFEDAWKSLIEEFNLQENSWLTSLYELRYYWIPAYFQDLKMGCLLRTTSRSESQNHFFADFIGQKSTLVVFMKQFEDALENQRHRQRKLDFESANFMPKLQTPLPLEDHCSSVYTISVFYLIQFEIVAAVYSCQFISCEKVGDDWIFIIRSGDGSFFTTKHATLTDEFSCSCNKFIQVGFPCSHMFTVFRTVNAPSIPEKCILPRWTKQASLNPVFQVDEGMQKEGMDLDEKLAMKSELLNEVHSYVSLIENDINGMKSFLSLVKRESTEFMKSQPLVKSRTDRFQNFLGPVPNVVDIHPPPKTQKKGRPREKRLVGIVEAIRVQHSKEARSCGRCNQPGHNIRTCTVTIQE